jgi:hypothetical protein
MGRLAGPTMDISQMGRGLDWGAGAEAKGWIKTGPANWDGCFSIHDGGIIDLGSEERVCIDQYRLVALRSS